MGNVREDGGGQLESTAVSKETGLLGGHARRLRHPFWAIPDQFPASFHSDRFRLRGSPAVHVLVTHVQNKNTPLPPLLIGLNSFAHSDRHLPVRSSIVSLSFFFENFNAMTTIRKI